MSENAWIEWSGGTKDADPLGSKATTEVRFRSGNITTARGDSFDWSRLPDDSPRSYDIMAYRLSGPSA